MARLLVVSWAKETPQLTRCLDFFFSVSYNSVHTSTRCCICSGVKRLGVNRYKTRFSPDCSASMKWTLPMEIFRGAHSSRIPPLNDNPCCVNHILCDERWRCSLTFKIFHILPLLPVFFYASEKHLPSTWKTSHIMLKVSDANFLQKHKKFNFITLFQARLCRVVKTYMSKCKDR